MEHVVENVFTPRGNPPKRQLAPYNRHPSDLVDTSVDRPRNSTGRHMGLDMPIGRPIAPFRKSFCRPIGCQIYKMSAIAPRNGTRKAARVTWNSTESISRKPYPPPHVQNCVRLDESRSNSRPRPLTRHTAYASEKLSGSGFL
jgi:hypothetical protein